MVRRSPPPPARTKVTIVGKNEIYNRENLVGPFLVHKLLPPPPPPAHKSVLESANPPLDSEGASGCTWSTARATERLWDGRPPE